MSEQATRKIGRNEFTAQMLRDQAERKRRRNEAETARIAAGRVMADYRFESMTRMLRAKHSRVKQNRGGRWG